MCRLCLLQHVKSGYNKECQCPVCRNVSTDTSQLPAVNVLLRKTITRKFPSYTERRRAESLETEAKLRQVQSKKLVRCQRELFDSISTVTSTLSILDLSDSEEIEVIPGDRQPAANTGAMAVMNQEDVVENWRVSILEDTDEENEELILNEEKRWCVSRLSYPFSSKLSTPVTLLSTALISGGSGFIIGHYLLS